MVMIFFQKRQESPNPAHKPFQKLLRRRPSS
uniref:Uncharacterized protein n=1 Tax=Rhizophora mucronata TaxID=61149 RepID=A0A2P2QDQ5_RHIMU